MLIKEVLLILLSIGISACATSDECPREEDMPQCLCVYGIYSGLYLYCGENFSGLTIQEYVKIFQENNMTANKEMRLVFAHLLVNSKIPSRVFEGFDIKTLDIKFSTNILMWADEEGGPAFVGLENSLEKFAVFRSISIPRKYYYHEDKAPMSLGHLRKLRRVELTYNDIHTFANGWFDKGSSSLEILMITSCNTYYFGDRAFAELSNLKEIVMKHNEFQSLSRTMFPNPANQLETIDFRFNQLKYFSGDFFTNMPALTHVDLAGNPITHLPEHIWRPVWSQLIDLNLIFTPLNCGDYIHWMFSVKSPKRIYATCRGPGHMNGLDLMKFIERHSSKI